MPTSLLVLNTVPLWVLIKVSLSAVSLSVQISTLRLVPIPSTKVIRALGAQWLRALDSNQKVLSSVLATENCPMSFEFESNHPLHVSIQFRSVQFKLSLFESKAESCFRYFINEALFVPGIRIAHNDFFPPSSSQGEKYEKKFPFESVYCDGQLRNPILRVARHTLGRYKPAWEPSVRSDDKPPLMETRNPKGVTSALPISWVGIGCQTGGQRHRERTDGGVTPPAPAWPVFTPDRLVAAPLLIRSEQRRITLQTVNSETRVDSTAVGGA
ncbi:hypothetical protein EVAR_9696_1 [Eumeta japonica]|uniref:Uncharacterized protein n=1 Tax=Eumeta variegata TaxID=151549 RepID=A0A4C1Y8H0_EUMVA|nr:hypothetical protein EVAR_9696_1 [Eumeta japonica]